MKSLFFSKAAFAAILLFFCLSFTHSTQRSSVQRDVFYYWYLDSGTVYDGWRSVSQEIQSLEERYGVEVDGDPIDGSLIASGYAIKGYPHEVYASYLLYSH